MSDQPTIDDKIKDELVAEHTLKQWTTDDEVALLYALRNHKPVGKSFCHSLGCRILIIAHLFAGVDRFFQMIIIQDALNERLKQGVTTNAIWSYLDTLYDMDTLVSVSTRCVDLLLYLFCSPFPQHENEEIPFPNADIEFSLPEEFFKKSQPEPEGHKKKSSKNPTANRSKSLTLM